MHLPNYQNVIMPPEPELPVQAQLLSAWAGEDPLGAGRINPMTHLTNADCTLQQEGEVKSCSHNRGLKISMFCLNEMSKIWILAQVHEKYKNLEGVCGDLPTMTNSTEDQNYYFWGNRVVLFENKRKKQQY